MTRTPTRADADSRPSEPDSDVPTLAEQKCPLVRWNPDPAWSDRVPHGVSSNTVPHAYDVGSQLPTPPCDEVP